MNRVYYIVTFWALMMLPAFESCGQGMVFTSDNRIESVRDSLDAVLYAVPEMTRWKPSTIIEIMNQEQWDGLKDILVNALKRGEKNIELRVKGKNIVFGKWCNVVQGLDYPDANIRIVGTQAKMEAYGFTFIRDKLKARIEGNGYTYPYESFDVNDLVLGADGNEIPLRGEAKLVSGDIEKVQEFKGPKGSRIDDVWRFQIDLPNLSEEQCKDFYVLMTRDWTSARHKVVKVEDEWLYYHLDSDDYHSDRDPNVDWIQYKVRPRYRLINSPISNDVHFFNGRIYIPQQYKLIKVVKGGQLLTFSYCHFNRLEITGFKLNGCGGSTTVGIYSSTFENGAFIYGNTFKNMNGITINTAFNRNVSISNNTVTNTRVQAIEGGGTKTTICGNRLKNIGWMLNTRAITGGGEHLHICDNLIEDFNYGAIACGSTMPNHKACPLTYIIEHNIIRLTKEFTDRYIENTLADGGGIYTGPQCTWGIIRNNVVENIKGIHSNRGIFLDDGAKNLAIYGNLIIGTANSYDIDLRYSKGYADGIPDHNTNNILFGNYLTGSYRFQDGGAGSRCVEGANQKVSGFKFRALDSKVQEVQKYFQLIDKR